MITKHDALDFSTGKRYRRKSDGLEVTAIEMRESFQIVLPDDDEQRDHVRIEPEVVVENGRKEVRQKEIKCKAKVIHAYGGTIRGLAGDYVLMADNGFVFAVSNRSRDTKEAPAELFDSTFIPI
jgi:hypothetical protein